MKKLLLLTAILGSVTILPAVSNAATASAVNSEQVVYSMRTTQPRFRRGIRTVIRTRTVYRFGRRYRETIRVTYRGNRIIRTQVVSRVRLGGRIIRNY